MALVRKMLGELALMQAQIQAQMQARTSRAGDVRKLLQRVRWH